MPNIRQLAQLAGVSTWTVSKALRGSTEVSAETRRRIQELAAHHHYTPYRLPPPVSDGEGTIGVLFPFYEYPICVRTLNGIITTIQPEAYRSIIYSTDAEMTRISMLLHTLVEHQVAGIILYTGSSVPVPVEVLFGLRSRAIPLVCIDITHFTMPTDLVRTDDAQAAELIAEHLYHQGHRTVVIMRNRDMPDARWREEALLAAFHRRGLPLVQAPKAQHFGVSFASEEDGLSGIVARCGTPVAIIAREDRSAAALHRQAVSQHLEIPGAVSIVGYGNLYITDCLVPGLTTLDQDPDEIGRQAVTLLLRRIAEQRQGVPWAPETVFVPARIVERGSTGVPRR
jgi:DNA-binding LacI/PurR family transcriptional regulator